MSLEQNNPAEIKDYKVILNNEKTIYENKKLALYHIGDYCDAHNGDMKKYYQNIYNQILASDEGYDDKSKVEKERYYTMDDYETEDAILVPAEELDGWYWRKFNDGSGCLISPNNNEYMVYDLQTKEYQFKRDKGWSYFSTPEEPMKNSDFFKAAEQEIIYYGVDLYEKTIQFNQLCGDWDFRNTDMTEAHLQAIDINNKKGTIKISCEWFSPELDDYVSCDAGEIKNKSLIEEFKKLDLEDHIAVNQYINDVEKKVNWKKINNKLEYKTTRNMIYDEIENLNLRDTWCSYGPLKKGLNFNCESISMDFRKGVLSERLDKYLTSDYGDDGFVELNAYKNLDNDEYNVYLVVISKTTKKVFDKVDITDKLLEDDMDFIKESIDKTYHRKEFEI